MLSNHAICKYAACLILLAACCVPGNGAETDAIIQSRTPRTNAAFSCIMHVHTRMSSGNYQLPELTRIAREQGVDAIFLSDNLTESIEFGLPPLRHVFWAGHRENSVLTIGGKRFLAEVRRENERLSSAARGQPDVLYIPGVEIVPRFYWSGSLREKNLVCHNHQRDLIVIGTENICSLINLPVTCGYVPGRDTAWIVITRLLLVLFIGAILGVVFLPRRLARRSGFTAGMIRRSFFFGLILPLALLMILVNFVAGLMPGFRIYSPDDPGRFEQRVLDALKRENLVSFWAHPEATDHGEFKYLGVSFAVDTRPYPEVLVKTRGYTGFAGINDGENKFVDPGSIWDMVLKQYLDGERGEPAWCFGEMLYHYEGQAGKKLSNVETIVWAPEKKTAALLDSIRRGYFYSRSNYGGQSLVLDQWRVNGLESGRSGQATNGAVNISLRVSARLEGEALAEPADLSAEAIRAKGEVPIATRLGEALRRSRERIGTKEGEKAEVLIIRNGAVIKKDRLSLPFDMEISDSLPSAVSNAYYRAVVSGKYPVRLVTNPIFVVR